MPHGTRKPWAVEQELSGIQETAQSEVGQTLLRPMTCFLATL